MSGAKVNLGQVYVQERNFDAALTLLREAIATEPYNVTAAYTLATALTRSGAQDEGRAAMERFQTLRDSTYGNTYAQTYLAQGKYAEALASTGAEPDLVNPRRRRVTFADATSTMLPREAAAGPRRSRPAYEPWKRHRCVDARSTWTAIWTSIECRRVRSSASYRNARGVLTRSVRPRSASGRMWRFDRRRGRRLRQRRPAGSVRPSRRRQPAPAPAGRRAVRGRHGSGAHPGIPVRRRDPRRSSTSITTATSISSSSASQAGAGPNPRPQSISCSATTATAPSPTSPPRPKSVAAPARGIAVVPTDFDNRRDMDLARGRSRRCADALPERARRIVPRCGGRRAAAAAADVHVRRRGRRQQGRLHRLLPRHGGRPGRARDERRQRPVRVEPRARRRPPGRWPRSSSTTTTTACWICWSSRPQAPHLFSNVGNAWVEGQTNGVAPAAAPFQSMAVGDIDGDGDEDVVVRARRTASCASGGTTAAARIVRCTCGWRVESATAEAWARRSTCAAGSLRQRLESSAATPSVAPADLRFGLGTRATADAVRVLWPSGTLQTELDLGRCRRRHPARRPASSP